MSPAEKRGSGSLVTLTAGRSRAEIDPADGARLVSLDLGGGDLIVARDRRDPMWWGAFIMAPWASSLREVDGRVPDGFPDAEWHGVARHLSWTAESSSECSADFSVGIGELWAGGGRLSAGFSLADGCLELELVLRAGTAEFPAALGWHPWFVREMGAHTAELRLHETVQVQHRASDGRATREWQAVSPAERGHAWDDCMIAEWPVVVDYPGRGRLSIESTASYVTVFDEDPAGICVEPVTSPAEFLDATVTPESDLAMRVEVRWLSPRVESASAKR